MKPLLVHRYSIPTVEAIEMLVGSAAGDAEAWQIRVEGDHVLVDLVEPADAPRQQRSAAEAPEARPSPQNAPAAAPAGKASNSDRKGGPLAARAGIICNEGAFHVWAEVKSVEEAANFIRDRCGIRSRADLDHDETAALLFRDMDREYSAWLAGAE